jgi:hypothetical protein
MAIATDGFSEISLFIPIVTAGDGGLIDSNLLTEKSVEGTNQKK